MKSIFFIFLVLLNRSEGRKPLQSEEEEEDSSAVMTKPEITTWPEYVKAYKRHYDDLEIGNEKRRKLFEDKYNHIKEWNEEYEKGLHDFRKGINRFTAMTKEELPLMKNPIKIDWDFVGDQEPFLTDEKYPERVDWREKGIISKIKNQKTCQSCYAFSTIDSVESQYAKKYGGPPPSLSVQVLVDCSFKNGNHGCSGGRLGQAFDFIKEEGVPEEKYYPYVGKEQSCQNKTFPRRYKLKKYTRLPPGDEEMLMKAVAVHGPVAVTVDGTYDPFMDYDGGIFNDPGCRKDFHRHTAVVIGYGTEDGKDFWILKNSWGEDWGEGGYMRLSRNKGNICGVASEAVYPSI